MSNKSVTLLSCVKYTTVSRQYECICSTMSAAVAMRLNGDAMLDVNVWRVVMTPVVALMLK